jgi:hypothetical protein
VQILSEKVAEVSAAEAEKIGCQGDALVRIYTRSDSRHEKLRARSLCISELQYRHEAC